MTEEPTCTMFEGVPQVRVGEEIDPRKVDCVVKLKEPQLMAIQSGELNPQIALVNEKVKVEGAAGLAMYFFNLVYPRSSIM